MCSFDDRGFANYYFLYIVPFCFDVNTSSYMITV